MQRRHPDPVRETRSENTVTHFRVTSAVLTASWRCCTCSSPTADICKSANLAVISNCSIRFSTEVEYTYIKLRACTCMYKNDFDRDASWDSPGAEVDAVVCDGPGRTETPSCRWQAGSRWFPLEVAPTNRKRERKINIGRAIGRRTLVPLHPHKLRAHSYQQCWVVGCGRDSPGHARVVVSQVLSFQPKALQLVCKVSHVVVDL